MACPFSTQDPFTDEDTEAQSPQKGAVSPAQSPHHSMPCLLTSSQTEEGLPTPTGDSSRHHHEKLWTQSQSPNLFPGAKTEI